MDLTDFLLDVATGYDRHDGLATPTQDLLRHASEVLSEHTPGGFQVIGSGGKGSATFSPWVGFFDPDETTSPQGGIYVVYLFAEDLQTVTLSLNQGITDLTKRLGIVRARERLAADASAIRHHLAENLEATSASMQLGSTGFRQRAYEAGNVAASTYRVAELPGEPTLRADLERFLRLYQLTVAVRRELLVTSPGLIATPSPPVESAIDDPLRDFKPKDDSDYVVHLQGRRLVKSRRHEGLLREFGTWVSGRGWRPSTAEHPKDLVLRSHRGTWIVEAKVVYQGNATDAVRASLGQLYSYRYFLPSGPDSRLLALFSEPIGSGFVEFLESCEIASAWKESGRWLGSPTAVAWRLAGETSGDPVEWSPRGESNP